MSFRTQRALQALILAALGMFLLQKILSGTLFWYINQRFMFLILLAGAGLLALAQTVFQDGRRAPPTHVPGALSAWGLVIVALPVMLGVLIPARPLGATAVANKGLNTTASLTAGGDSAALANIAPEQRTVLDWVRAFDSAAQPSSFDGQLADVEGFVYHDTRLPKGQFLVGRFALTCCVADATAIGMAVTWAETTPLPDNSWVRVRGPVQAASFNGRPLPLIVAASVAQINEPEQPYLYP